MKQLPLFFDVNDNGYSLKDDIEDSNNNLSPDTYKGIYAMHKYWSKKPHNLVANYISRYSSKGEIVLDPFCGSGVSIIESLKLGRRAIGIDINPIAVFSTLMALQHVDIRVLKSHFDILQQEIQPEIDKLYHTECPKCGYSQAVTTHTIWEHNSPRELWVACPACQTAKAIKSPSRKDLETSQNPLEKPRWFPTNELIENHRINARAGTRVCDLFTKRALVALSLLLARIRQIPDEKIRAIMEFCFSASLPQASNMVFVIRRRGKIGGDETNARVEVGSWVIGYWTPPEHFEIHVWRCFQNRFARIVKGKQEANSIIPSTAEPLFSFTELSQSSLGYWVFRGTATQLPIPSESVDYIFTDPPHGNRIPYLELSLMWNAWLGFEFDWEDEIVISEAQSRRKGANDYYRRLQQAFGEMWRVLKPDRYISIAFNSLNDETWLSLLNGLVTAGFEVLEVAPLEYSARSVVQDSRKNGLKTDFVLTGRKNIKTNRSEFFVNESRSQLEEAMLRYFASRTNGAETHEVITGLLTPAIPLGTVYKVSQIMQSLEKMCIYQNGWQLKPS